MEYGNYSVLQTISMTVGIWNVEWHILHSIKYNYTCIMLYEIHLYKRVFIIVEFMCP